MDQMWCLNINAIIEEKARKAGESVRGDLAKASNLSVFQTWRQVLPLQIILGQGTDSMSLVVWASAVMISFVRGTTEEQEIYQSSSPTDRYLLKQGMSPITFQNCSTTDRNIKPTGSDRGTGPEIKIFNGKPGNNSGIAGSGFLKGVSDPCHNTWHQRYSWSSLMGFSTTIYKAPTKYHLKCLVSIPECLEWALW